MSCSNGMHEDDDGNYRCNGECDDETPDTYCNHCHRYAWKRTAEGFCSEVCRSKALAEVYAEVSR